MIYSAEGKKNLINSDIKGVLVGTRQILYIYR